jgi:hypothetical protein
MAGLFDFDIETALLDDVAIAWDDPDAMVPVYIVVPPGATYEWTVATHGDADSPDHGYPTPFTLSDTTNTNLRIVGVAPAISVGTGGGAHVVSVGQASETDTAQAITRRKTVTVGQATETDTAQPITRVKSKLLGQPSETDTSQPMVFATSQAVVQATETDSAQPITRRKTKTIGQASETDTAQPVSVNPKRRLIGQASEADTAQTISPAVVTLVLLTPADDTNVDVTDGETFTWNAPGTQTTFAFRRRRVSSGPWEYWNGTTWQLTRAEITSATESVTFDPAEW